MMPPKLLEIALRVKNRLCHSDQELSKPKGHQNPINGSKVMAILPKGWILPIGGASVVEGLRSRGLPCQVFWGQLG